MAIYGAHLENRAVLKVTGAEREDFLQNLVTQDVTRARPQAAALLTPQGKLAHDFIIQPVNDGILIDCAAESTEAFVKKLTLYKLRRDVEITLTDLPVLVVWSDTPDAQSVEIENFFEDPRTARLGLRCLGASPADCLILPPQRPKIGLSFACRWACPKVRQKCPPVLYSQWNLGLSGWGPLISKKGALSAKRSPRVCIARGVCARPCIRRCSKRQCRLSAHRL